MEVRDHRLFDGGVAIPFRPTPNHGGTITPEYLIMHYTAGDDFGGSVAWLCDERAKASAHLVIGRNGDVVQLAPFNVKTWHAGKSSWQTRVGLNGFSIGIELDNAGKLDRRDNRWWSWTNRIYPDPDVTVAEHKHGGGQRGWHAYTNPQLERAIAIAVALHEAYKFKDVLGHEDISPGRKIDPGPAFPMTSFRSRVMGRQEDESDLFVTTAKLNIRKGPGVEHATVPGGPLPPGARVVVLSEGASAWKQVSWLDAVTGTPTLTGWVNGTFLRAA